MLDTRTGWAVTTALAVLRTIDGGISWKDVSPKNIPTPVDSNIVADFLSASNAWVGISPFSTPPVQVFRTTNGGQTWRLSTAPSDNLGQISFINAQDGWMLAGLQAAAGAQAVEVLRTSDGGATWIKVSSASPTHASLNALPPGATNLSFIDTSTGWGTGTTPASTIFLYVTHDGGFHWQKQTLPLPPNLEGGTINTEPPTFFSDRDGILPVSVPASNSLTPSFYVYVTHDSGASWLNPMLLSASINTSDFIDVNHGWAADSTGQSLYTTGDGGRHWTKIATITGLYRYLHLRLVDLKTAKSLILITLPLGALGAIAARHVPAEVLRIGYGIAMLGLAGLLLRDKPGSKVARNGPAPAVVSESDQSHPPCGYGEEREISTAGIAHHIRFSATTRGSGHSLLIWRWAEPTSSAISVIENG